MPRDNKAADTLPEIAADLLVHRPKSGLGSDRAKMMEFWPKAALVQLKDRKRNRQTESPGASASWIEIEHSVNGLDPGLMGVAGDHDIDAAGYGIDPEVVDIVQHMK